MKPGDRAPEFELVDETGATRTLGGLLEAGPLVLYFYPAAMTSGCTAESCHFRDLAAEFSELGSSRAGISPDAVAKQREFAGKHSFDFPLLSDPDGAVARRFGVRRSFGPLLTRRRTFVIDIDATVLEVIASELRMSVHADRALAALRERAARLPGD